MLASVSAFLQPSCTWAANELSWLSTLSGKPTEALLWFPYTAQLGLCAYVAIYRHYYRTGKRDIYISWMFQNSRYGISIMYGLMSCLGELQAVYWAHRSLEQSGKTDANQLAHVAMSIVKPALVRWAFALGRTAIVTSTFEYHTESYTNQSAHEQGEPLNENMREIHGTCVKILAFGAALQWFSVQFPGFSFHTQYGSLAAVGSLLLPVAAYAGFNSVSGKLYKEAFPDDKPGAPTAHVSDTTCWVSCMLETVALGISIARPAGFV
jgi:hypothetical protein